MASKKPSVEPVTVFGGVHDTYGEDSATEKQRLTPWVRTIARYQCP